MLSLLQISFASDFNDFCVCSFCKEESNILLITAGYVNREALQIVTISSRLRVIEKFSLPLEFTDNIESNTCFAINISNANITFQFNMFYNNEGLFRELYNYQGLFREFRVKSNQRLSGLRWECFT
ncbi:hypothetical protein CWI36_1995p0010 [Hamiltosporidium magnivora]|uniref:Uncharacterized protein n=1 Tax=Hamiltosporidium magnivora TaxID=148818 RepID=A0A4Q9KWU4_9MICR|nr:hypothetical protein CWI36_1995p0010 [Hamiltosporidium magnivora]